MVCKHRLGGQIAAIVLPRQHVVAKSGLGPLEGGIDLDRAPEQVRGLVQAHLVQERGTEISGVSSRLRFDRKRAAKELFRRHGPAELQRNITEIVVSLRLVRGERDRLSIGGLRLSEVPGPQAGMSQSQ